MEEERRQILEAWQAEWERQYAAMDAENFFLDNFEIFWNVGPADAA